MKEYIKAITAGFLAGITVTQLLNMAVQAWKYKSFYSVAGIRTRSQKGGAI